MSVRAFLCLTYQKCLWLTLLELPHGQLYLLVDDLNGTYNISPFSIITILITYCADEAEAEEEDAVPDVAASSTVFCIDLTPGEVSTTPAIS